MRTLLDQIIAQKNSRLCVALDVTRSEEFFHILDQIAPSICLLKTHIDVLEDFSPAFLERLKKHASDHNYLLFEDRKFADIGNTVRLQYEAGIYHIRDWSHLVTVHALVGPGIFDALAQSMGQRNDRGFVVLAQMSAKGSLLDVSYTKHAVELATSYPHCIGFIGNGSNLEQITQLRQIIGPHHIIFTPGISLESKGDSLGQQYGDPRKARAAGADILIVGRAITHAQDPAKAAEEYRKASQ